MNKLYRNGFVWVSLVAALSSAASGPAQAAVFFSDTFTGDADSGISALKTYTHAANIRGPAVTINGVPFEAGDTSGTNWTLSGTTNTVDNSGAGLLTGNAGQLVSNFRHGPSNGVATLTLSGLTPGETYTTTWYNKAWGSEGGRIVHVAAADGFATRFDENLGGNNAGNLLGARFVAPAGGTFSFAFYNPTHTFHHYAFSTEVSSGPTAPAGFETAVFNDDAGSGIGLSTLYTHTVDTAGTAPNRYVNGVMFERGMPPTGGVASGSNWNITGANSGWSGSSGNVTGGIGSLISDFWYNGNPQTVALSGLVPGEQYVATFYGRGFGGLGERIQTVTVDDGTAGSVIDEILFDQNFSGDGNGNLLRYRYTAPASGELRFSFTPQVPGTFHNYAFSNEMIPDAPRRLLLTDSFNSGIASDNVNHNVAARQMGALGPLTYTQIGSSYQQQVGNTGNQHPHSLLLADGGAVGIDHNFNGADSEGGLRISFDLDPSWAVDGDWGAVTLGADNNAHNGWVNRGETHFGILFRGDGRLQAFDGSTNLTPVEPLWGGTAGQFHRFDLVLTDPTDGNPFDGVGQTTIDVYVNGGDDPVYSFTKYSGGYANNYIGFQGVGRAEFNNLVIAQIPEPSSFILAVVGLVWVLLPARRRSRK